MLDTQARRGYSACGYVIREDGAKEIVIAGGGTALNLQNSTEILSLDTLTWRYGPDLPYSGNLVGLASVQMEKSFLAVGGSNSPNSGGLKYKSIFKYDNENDRWLELPQKLKEGGFLYDVIPVPESYCL